MGVGLRTPEDALNFAIGDVTVHDFVFFTFTTKGFLLAVFRIEDVHKHFV